VGQYNLTAAAGFRKLAAAYSTSMHWGFWFRVYARPGSDKEIRLKPNVNRNLTTTL
jgi:hypothetical protein